MQRERSALDSFPEPIDLNQGSLPNNNTSMDHSPSWDPVENRLSNYMLGPTDGNVNCTNAASDTCQSLSGRDRGESSSTANNMQDDGENSKMHLGWSSIFNSCSGPDSTSENWSFEPPCNIGSSSSRPLSIQNYSSNRAVPNLSSNNGHMREIEQIPTFYASSSNVGNFSGSSSDSAENNDASGSSSFGSWGSSCKRKALEGTSGQFYTGGSSSSNHPMEKNMMQHPVPGYYSSPGNLSISSAPVDLSPPNYSEQLNPSSGVGMSRQSPGFFSSSSVLSDSSARNFTLRSNYRPVPFDTPRGSSSSRSNYGAHPSRPMSTVDFSELRSPITAPINPNNAHLTHLNEARGMHPYPWNGSFGSRGGSSSSSYSGAREDVGVRTSRRHNNNNINLQYPLNLSSSPETRNVVQEQIDWSFAPGRTSLSSRSHSSVPRVAPGGSSGRTSSPAWLPHQNVASQDRQRLSEAAPWMSFHRVEPESGIRRGHFLHPSTSLDEAGPSSRAQHQFDQRSAGFLMDMPGEDINGWRALAAVEGRHRLIRQVLTAMRRGVHLQGEEYMLVDPFISGFAELHDRHRDMRLDVDNMSYEELLALEERIGNVNTGLSEEGIKGSLKQRKFEAMGVLQNLEPCCVCQEAYINGDDIGILDCGHEFHTGCIKQWLTVKNLCPICKMAALETRE